MTLPLLTNRWSPNYSARGNVAVDKIVVHDCEGSYNGSVSWFLMAKSRVSAHIVLSEDGTHASQMVGWNNKAWHACDYNSESEGIEAAGYASKGLGKPEWAALAAIVAWRLHVRGLQPIWARGGAGPGVCQHADLGQKGGGHHDITPDTSIWQGFMSLVQAAYAGPQPDNWSASVNLPVLSTPNFVPSGTTRHDLVVGTMAWVQMELNVLALKGMPVLTVDGLDGPNTRMVVAAFQRAHQLRVDGDVGPQTIGALKKLV